MVMTAPMTHFVRMGFGDGRGKHGRSNGGQYDRLEKSLHFHSLVRWDCGRNRNHTNALHFECNHFATVHDTRGNRTTVPSGMRRRPSSERTFSETFPEADVHRLDGVGHDSLEDAPDLISSHVASFLEQT